MTGICSFYKHYNIPLPVIPKSTTKAKPELKRIDIPDKDDLRQVLTYCDPLERAILLVGISSGLSVVEISNLKARDFIEGYDRESGITKLHLIRQKTNTEFTTFLSPECSQTVFEYLEYRNREGKTDETRRKNQLKKQHLILDKSGKPAEYGYLFVTRTVPDSYLKADKKTKPEDKEQLRKLDEKSIMALYRRLNEEARANAPHEEYNLIRSHNMRRFFNSALLNAGASIFFVDYMFGHQLDAVHDAYYRANTDSLREEYKKYLPYVTIEKELDISESDEFKRIKAEHATLLAEAERHRVERSELQELRKEIERLKNFEAEREREVREFKPILKEETDYYYGEIEESEALKAHRKRLEADDEYFTQWKNAVIKSRPREIEIEKQEIKDNIVKLAGKSIRGTKTFDSLL